MRLTKVQQDLRTFVSLITATLLLAGCEASTVVAPELSDASPQYDDTQCPDSTCGDDTYQDPVLSYGSSVDHHVRWGLGHGDESFTSSSFSRVFNSTYISSARVDATAYHFAVCRERYRKVWYSGSKTVYGVGEARVTPPRFTYDYGGTYGFQIIATHTFNAPPGQPGGATYSSESSECDDGGTIVIG